MFFFVKKYPIEFVSYTGEFRYAEKDGRKSVVALCTVSNIDRFFDEFSRETRIHIPYQPTHVTLYTLGKDAGIGLDSPSEMKNLSVPVDVPDEVKNALGLL